MTNRPRLQPSTAATRRGVLASMLALPLLSACGSGDPTYFTLQTWPGAIYPAGPPSIEIRTPNVASLLDRDYIVRSTVDYQLKLAGNEAWAEPIADMIARILTEDIAQRFPRSTVFKSGAPISAAPSAIVELVISRFDEDQSGSAVLHAVLVVRPANSEPVASTTISLSQRPAGSSTAGLVAALSQMLGAVADQAADRLQRLQAAGPTPLTAG